jgi:hypothetical protein
MRRAFPAAGLRSALSPTLGRGSVAAQQWRASTPAARSVKPVLVEHYGRSRLYDVANRRYVSIAQLRHWAVEGEAFVMLDAETGLDVTRVLLA